MTGKKTICTIVVRISIHISIVVRSQLRSALVYVDDLLSFSFACTAAKSASSAVAHTAAEFLAAVGRDFLAELLSCLARYFLA